MWTTSVDSEADLTCDERGSSVNRISGEQHRRLEENDARNIDAPGNFRVDLGQRRRKTICGNNDAIRKREGVIVE